MLEDGYFESTPFYSALRVSNSDRDNANKEGSTVDNLFANQLNAEAELIVHLDAGQYDCLNDNADSIVQQAKYSHRGQNDHRLLRPIGNGEFRTFKAT
ncbi:hypothetical protein PoB_002900100 [Plakobranchus ocellatus]|uniref:Uncharacterized protein n=1 Tax=Plakobranchus ocellatus TaxID=259542 RepID=A0AAV4A2V2_9GAST|nr:hypothetical protein PoB_002900100 [Plakobranchus ocellatus]